MTEFELTEEVKAMIANRESIRNRLLKEVLEVTFTKVDGTERKMKCTLKSDMLPASEAASADKPRETPTDAIAVWDLEKSAWRSFKASSVKEIANAS